MASVNISNVSKTFGATNVLRSVDFHINDGEFVVLVGPSGCGKSTLLRMIAGLEAISEGDISIGGKRVNSLPPKDRDIAMVFQSYALYPHMNVRDNMGFSMKLANAARDIITSKVQKAAGALMLDSYLERYPRELSGGQRQRVAMGRAIVRDPKIFLFDEPLSNLDAKLRVQMRVEIKALHQRLKTTSVYVTHDQVEAMTMADRIVVMRDGVVEQIGSPLDLYDRPANQFVAGFIGSPSMNFVIGRLEERASQPVFVMPSGGVFEVPSGLGTGAAVGQTVVCGIRPEHFRLDEKGQPMRVTVVEQTGSATLIHCEVGGASLCATFSNRYAFAPGEMVHLAVAAEHVHLFHPETGAALIHRHPTPSGVF